MIRIEKVELLTEDLPVTIDELRNHLRLPVFQELESTLQTYLLAAIESAENTTGLKLIPRKYTVSGDFSKSVKTELMPIRSVEFLVIDGEVMSPLELLGVIIDDSTVTFPTGSAGNNFNMQLITGYPKEQFPYPLKAAILLIAAKLFQNPSDSVENLPKASSNLLQPYRRWGR